MIWWDRLFGTYSEKPAAGDNLIIGLSGFRVAGERTIVRLLTQPFREQRSRDPPPLWLLRTPVR